MKKAHVLEERRQWEGKLFCPPCVTQSLSTRKCLEANILRHAIIQSTFILFFGRYFAYVFDLVIFANAILIGLERNDAEVVFSGAV